MNRVLLRKILVTLLGLAVVLSLVRVVVMSAPGDDGVYRAYYEFLSGAVAEHGPGHRVDNIHGGENFRGVIYAELIDFDNNGVPELLLIYGSDVAPYSADCVVYGYSRGFIEELGRYELYLNHLMLDIALSHDGSSFLIHNFGDSFGNDAYYYTFVNNQWIQVLNRGYIIHEIEDNAGNWLRDEYEWYIDGRNVSEQEFNRVADVDLGIIDVRDINIFIDVRDINIFNDPFDSVDNLLVYLEMKIAESATDTGIHNRYEVNNEPFDRLGKSHDEMTVLAGSHVDDWQRGDGTYYLYNISNRSYWFKFSGEESADAGDAHPYAIALREYFSDSGGWRAAYISDVTGLDEPAVLAVKARSEHMPTEDFRFFYMNDSSLQIYNKRNILDWPYSHVDFSGSNYLYESFGDEGYFEIMIHLFENGEIVPNAVTLTTYTDIWGMPDPDDWSDWESYTWWERNGVRISKTEYEGYISQYGFDSWIERPDQTDQILAMTVDIPDDDAVPRIAYIFECYLSDIINGIGNSVSVSDLNDLFMQQSVVTDTGEEYASYELVYEYGGTRIFIRYDPVDNGSVPGEAYVKVILEADRFTHPGRPGQYETERPGPGHGGSVAGPDDLREINDPESADKVIEDILTSMTPEQRESGDALDETALFLENAVSRGSGEGMPRDGELSADVLGNLTGNANEIMDNTRNLMTIEEIRLLRDIRTDVSIRTDDREAFQATFPDDVSDVGFDNVVIESDFVSVKLPNSSINVGDAIEVRNLNFGGSSGSSGSERSGRGFKLQDFWSIYIVLIIFILWGILWLNNHKFRAWVVPTFCLIAVGVNLIILFASGDSGVPIGLNRERTTDLIEVVMSDGMDAVISLPATEAEKDTLVMFNADGEPHLSKYNPVTGTIDTSISASGVYELREYSVDFNDIEDKDAMMKEAITQLASRNIMTGNAEGAFNPDDLITRAEFISAAIRVFDMLDYDAVTGFIDVTRSDWYYHAVATAEQENLMSGFEDNTFRGDNRIPKDLMVVITANMLIEQMGYIVPPDIEAEIQRYLDREEIERWSEDGIALATQANILIYRIDGMFAPQSTITRGDAAIVLYRVFNKVW